MKKCLLCSCPMYCIGEGMSNKNRILYFKCEDCGYKDEEKERIDACNR